MYHELTGNWCIELPRTSEISLRTYFIFRREHGVLGGTVIINDAVEVPMLDMESAHGEVAFRIEWGIDYRFRAIGDRMRVVIRYRDKRTEEAIAVRVGDAEVRAPLPLPLPSFAPVQPNGLARTPPMGWNSWNHFEDRVSDLVVREIADAMVGRGLAAAGYEFINVDDSWEGGRDSTGRLVPNAKFPDMKALADHVHSLGLKFGIYSSPGVRTCGGYLGSHGHEEQDARTFAEWGVDFLKYDWCGAARIYGNDTENLRAGYLKMAQALAKCGRPIVYSICEYGLGRVWEWGAQVGGNLWRTTYDISDTWESMSRIGFSQHPHARFAGPGHWNDPDMLEVGNGGMSADEYRTHFSLWCLLAAPLIAGNDLRSMSDETLQILTNREAIAVDQDPLGTQGRRIVARAGIEIWTKPLHGGDIAIGIFNRTETAEDCRFSWEDLTFTSPPSRLRDLWVHRDLEAEARGFSTSVAPHGVCFLRAEFASQN